MLKLNKCTKTKHKPKPTLNFKNCSYVCAYHCAQLLNTTQHRTVLIIFPLILQTIIIAQMMEEGRAPLEIMHSFTDPVLLSHDPISTVKALDRTAFRSALWHQTVPWQHFVQLLQLKSYHAQMPCCNWYDNILKPAFSLCIHKFYSIKFIFKNNGILTTKCFLNIYYSISCINLPCIIFGSQFNPSACSVHAGENGALSPTLRRNRAAVGQNHCIDADMYFSRINNALIRISDASWRSSSGT